VPDGADGGAEGPDLPDGGHRPTPPDGGVDATPGASDPVGCACDLSAAPPGPTALFLVALLALRRRRR
jgi:MYXO-CTERM domain-containing protein